MTQETFTRLFRTRSTPASAASKAVVSGRRLGQAAAILALAASAGLGLAAAAGGAGGAGPEASAVAPSGRTPRAALQGVDPLRVRYQTVKVNGVNVFYREAGPKDAPVILLLHGFPTSSYMFRNLMPALADRYRVIAPDYPGYGQSDQPPVESFEYSFDNLARVVDGFTRELGLTRFALYVQDYGAPIGFRLASATPERITGLIVQNGNAYEEGLDNDFWKPIKAYWADPSEANRKPLVDFLTLEGTRWQYLHGARDAANISPDSWVIDQAGMDRPGNKDIQARLFLSYGTNPPLYPAWQKYFREHQPPTLIVWGKNDQIFPAAGAEPYLRDLRDVDYNILDTGHFALEEEGALIAQKIRTFMQNRVAPGR